MLCHADPNLACQVLKNIKTQNILVVNMVRYASVVAFQSNVNFSAVVGKKDSSFFGKTLKVRVLSGESASGAGGNPFVTQVS